MTQTKVLVVDNDSNTYELLSGQQPESLIEPQCVINMEEALTFLERWQPDVVVVNSQLARQDDFILIQALRDKQQHQKPAIVICSSPADGSLVEFRLRFNIQFFLQKPFDAETLTKKLLDFAGVDQSEPADANIDLKFDPVRSQRNVLDVDDDFAEEIQSAPQEDSPQDIKDAMGVFSTNKPVVIGYGTTTRRIRVKEYLYVVRNGDNFLAQGINSVHVPSGEKFSISKNDLLSNYDPEMDYMYKKMLPALRNLENTLAKGDRHRSRMEHFSAEMEYNEALQIDAENVRATFGLGLTYLELQDSKKADAVFKSLIHLDAAFDEEHKHLFNEFGIQLRKNKMFDHAVQYYDRARELSKEDENIFFNLARAWYEKGDWSNCLRNLIICLTMNKQLEEAQRFCRHILVLSLNDDLCRELNKATLPTENIRYASMLEELRQAAGLTEADWKALQAEVTADKKKRKKAASKKKNARSGDSKKQKSPSDPQGSSNKKDGGQNSNGSSGKYVMPF